MPRARRQPVRDRLPGQGLRQLLPGAVRLLRAAVPAVGRTVRGRPRRHADGGAQRARGRAELPSRTGSPPRPTSTPRRSAVAVLRHARLVDYEPAPATVGHASLLQLDVAGRPIAVAQPRAASCAPRAGPDGQAVVFEAGDGLADPVPSGVQLDPRWNRAGTAAACGRPTRRNPVQLVPYWWDDSDRCCRAGATELWLVGHRLGLTGPAAAARTDGPTSADPPVRELDHACRAAPTHRRRPSDQLFSTAVTRLTWSPPALANDHDLTVTGSPATWCPRCRAAGSARASRSRRSRPALADPAPPAVVRIGHDAPGAAVPTPLHPRPGPGPGTPDRGAAAWLASSGGTPLVGTRSSRSRRPRARPSQPGGEPGTWPWCRRLLDAGPDRGVHPHARAVLAVAMTTASTCFDYDGDDGDTIRFGDGIFGAASRAGHRVPVTLPGRRRRGGQRRRPTRSRPSRPAGPERLVVAAPTRSRPRGGADAETREQVRDRAPRGVPGPAAVRDPAGGLRGRRAIAALGAAGRHGLPLDRELADRLHHR